MITPIPYGKHHITDQDIEAVVDVLKNEFLTQGSKVALFEKDFAEFVDSPFAVATCNGTAALHLGMKVLGVKKGTKVLTTPMSFVATSNSILYCDGEVEFIDIDTNSYLMNFDLLEERLAKSTTGEFSGIAVTDFAGHPHDMEKLRCIADKYKLWILEDACHALGASWENKNKEIIKVGSSKYADLSVFSFHPVKHLTTGEGGMITTRNADLYEKLCLLRTHGITKNPKKFSHEPHGGWYYEMQELGYNYRITDIQCALGISQLKRMNENIKRRRIIADVYNYSLRDLVIIPKVYDKMYHAYHLYVIQTDKKKDLYEYLNKFNIYTQVLYLPIHMQPYYQKLGYPKGICPVAESYYKKSLSLPMFHSMTENEQNFVIGKIISFF